VANKLKLASERRKLALRALILNNRQRVATLQDQTKRARDELRAYSGAGGSKQAGGAVTRLPRVSLGGR
jgi:hypothetical protein